MKKLITFLFVSFLVTTKLLAGAASYQVASGASTTTIQGYMSAAVTAGNTDITLQFAKGGTWGTTSADITIAVPAGVTKLTFTADPATTGATPVLYLNTLTYADGLMTDGIVFNGVKLITAIANRYLITPTSTLTRIPAKITIKNCWVEGYRSVFSSTLATVTTELIYINSVFKNLANEGAFRVSVGTIQKVTIRNNTFINVGGDASGATGADYFIDFRSPNSVTSQINFSNNTIYYPRTQGRGLFRTSGNFTTGYLKENNNLYATGNAATFALQLLYNNLTAGTSTDADSTNYYSNKMTLGGNKGSMIATTYVENDPSNLFVNPAADNFTINDPNFVGKIKVGNPSCFFPATVNITGSNLVNFNYNVGSGPSTEQTFTFSTIVLRGAVTLTAPANYEISTDNSTYTGTLTLGGLGNDLTNQTIYVRLKAGLSLGTYNESITLSTTQAADQYVTCSGAVTIALPALETPAGLTSSAITYTGFHASWAAVANVTSYTLRVLLNGSAVQTITGINGTSYDITGLTPGGNYTFAVTAIGDAVNYNSSNESSQSGSIQLPYIYLYTSKNNASAGTVSPSSGTYSPNASVQLTATKNFGYAFVNWVDSVSGSALSTANPYTVTMDGTKHIKAIFNTLNTYKLTVDLVGGAKSYMVSAAPAATVVNGNNMYEDGTVVTLTASNNSILTFSNWSDNSTNSTLTLTMNQDQTTTATYSAVDYIVGWDFYASGNTSRPADFYSTSDNSTSTLITRNAAGTSSSWLDKSVSSGSYYGRGAAVNWKNGADLYQYYYQTSFVATDFTDIKVAAGMLYNYNARSIQKCEYSLDGSTFIPVDTYTMSVAQTWYDKTINLPAECNHASRVYVRWIPDNTSAIVGATPANDGTAISAIYITGTQAAYNDGLAPTLSSSVPANSGTGASATGKVVLNFSKNVQVAGGTTATLGSKILTPAVSGKSISFSYSGLNYNTSYTFTLAAGTVSDIFGNTLSNPVTFSFTTMNRPTVTKKSFDFVVGVDGNFSAAIAAATAASSSGNRFRIFFPDGQYNIGTATGNSNQMTTITLPNVSFVGQSSDGTVLYNQNTTEGISSTATMYFTNTANNLYIQDLSLKNNDYRSGSASLGRCVALWDQGTKNIYKNVNVLSNQDTYYSGTGRTYFEGGSIHGTVDFICGGGDVFFNESLIYLESRTGNCITAPSTTTSYGYVFSGCTIDGFANTNGNFNLGRPWQNSPRTVYINTTMNVLPTAAGWTEMGVVPALFAEYNSANSLGTSVDVSMRKSSYTYNSVTTPVSPQVLTTEQAATYTIDNVLGGNDAWQPQQSTDQVAAPIIRGVIRAINWDDNDYVLCWGIFKDGNFVQFVTSNSYTIPNDVTIGSVYTVRAANEMGGLSTVSNSYTLNSTDYFRTKASGNWSEINSWQSSSDNSNWTPTSAAPTSSASNIIIQEGNELTVDADATASSLNINPGGKLTLNATKTLSINSLILNSDANGTATFVDKGTTIINGSATVQQHLTAGRNWYMSIPVTGSAIGTLNGSSVVAYSEPTASWVTETIDSTLHPLRGYISVNTTTTGVATFSGTLNTGTKSITLTRTKGQTKEGFNLVGNPYPSYVKWSTATRTNLEPTIWFRSRNSGNSAYIFDTYNSESQVGTGLNGIAVTDSIPPMQAFWVRVKPSVLGNDTTGTLMFDNSMRCHKGVLTNRLKSPSTAYSVQKVLRLQVSNGINADETIVLFNPNALDGRDNYDSPKMTNANAAVPEIYTKANSENLVINGLNSIETSNIIPLSFTTGQTNAYSIKATEIRNFDSNTSIYIRDNELKTEKEISDGSAYTFTSNASTTDTRFTVIFKSPSITTDNHLNSTFSNITVFANRNNQISIKSNKVFGVNDRVTIYNSIGQQLIHSKLIESLTVIDQHFNPGVYVVTMEINGEIKNEKVIVKQ